MNRSLLAVGHHPAGCRMMCVVVLIISRNAPLQRNGRINLSNNDETYYFDDIGGGCCGRMRD